MRKVKFVFQHYGEVYFTPYQLNDTYENFIKENGHEELKKKKEALLFHDDWYNKKKIDKYKVIELELPSNTNINHFMDFEHEYSQIFSCLGIDRVDREFTKVALENLVELLSRIDTIEKFTILEFLKIKKHRNEFMKSLKNQLLDWLNEEKHKYEFPFSYKQFEILKDKIVRGRGWQIHKYWNPQWYPLVNVYYDSPSILKEVSNHAL